MNDANILTHDDVIKAQQGLPLQIYDAFLLFADKDIDFTAEVVERLEDLSFKLCLMNRDLLSRGMFQHDAILDLISERCHRVIVIVSATFLKSSAHTFFINVVHHLPIEQQRRKIIPCLYEKCSLPASLSSFFFLRYNQSGMLFDFWDNLSNSIRSTNSGH